MEEVLGEFSSDFETRGGVSRVVNVWSVRKRFSGHRGGVSSVVTQLFLHDAESSANFCVGFRTDTALIGGKESNINSNRSATLHDSTLEGSSF